MAKKSKVFTDDSLQALFDEIAGNINAASGIAKEAKKEVEKVDGKIATAKTDLKSELNPLIADAKSEGTAAKSAVTALENGKVKDNADEIVGSKSAATTLSGKVSANETALGLVDGKIATAKSEAKSEAVTQAKTELATDIADAKSEGTAAKAAVVALEGGQVKTNKEAIEALKNAVGEGFEQITATEVQQMWRTAMGS